MHEMLFLVTCKTENESASMACKMDQCFMKHWPKLNRNPCLLLTSVERKSQWELGVQYKFLLDSSTSLELTNGSQARSSQVLLLGPQGKEAL